MSKVVLVQILGQAAGGCSTQTSENSNQRPTTPRAQDTTPNTVSHNSNIKSDVCHLCLALLAQKMESVRETALFL